MDANELRLIALVNRITDAFYPNPDDVGPVGPWGPWIREALGRAGDLASLNPQPLPPVDGGGGFARMLASIALRNAREAGGEHGAGLLTRFSEDWCGTVILLPPLPKPHGDGGPRPPHPEESMILGAALFRAAGSLDASVIRKAGEVAGRRVFEHGYVALPSL